MGPVPPVSTPAGRRERNKRDKLERITAAARQLFAEHGVDEVTTQQIATEADVGAGTLFSYASSKAELLLLVQNANYRDSLERGLADSAAIPEPLEAVMAIVAPIVECNRVQVVNGRRYLQEIVFGDQAQPHHADALAIIADTEAGIARAIARGGQVTQPHAQALAHAILAVMFISMASTANRDAPVGDIVAEIREQSEELLRHQSRSG